MDRTRRNNTFLLVAATIMGIAVLGIIWVRAEKSRLTHEWLAQLDSDDARARRIAAMHINEFASKSDVVCKRLVMALQDDDANVRVHAAAALTKCDSCCLGEEIDTIVSALKDSDEFVRARIAEVIIKARAHYSLETKRIVRQAFEIEKEDWVRSKIKMALVYIDRRRP